MTAARSAVRKNDDCMDMDRWSSVHEPDIADQRHDFCLLIHGEVAKGPNPFVKPAEQTALDRADGGEMGSLQPLTLGKGGHAGHDLVALAKGDRITTRLAFAALQ